MTTQNFKIVKGSNASLVVQLYPVETDTGVNGIDLTGSTSFSAVAKRLDGEGSAVNFNSAAVTDAENGKVQLDYDTSDFTDVAVYTIQISYTDSNSKTRIYPSDGDSLRLQIVESLS